MKKMKKMKYVIVGVAAMITLAAIPFAGLNCCAAEETEVVIDETNFPDEIFRSYVKENFDKNGNGVLDTEENNVIEEISVKELGITTLEGIQYFINLKTLDCSGNNLTSLNVSENRALNEINCRYNNLTNLNVSQNAALADLDCMDNDLIHLDVGQNAMLTYLNCGYNALTNLDISQNTMLRGLHCYDNHLESLDVSKNTELRDLKCWSNNLSNLDVSHNTLLIDLVCDDNNLTNLDVSNNKMLDILSCMKNNLISLNLEQNTALRDLDCDDNNLTNLDVSKNTKLTFITCGGNSLTDLNISQNSALTFLSCYDNKITSLDLSRNTSLDSLNCSNNKLTSLDLSHNTALTTVSCSRNNLTTLDLSKHPLLERLFCGGEYPMVVMLNNNATLHEKEIKENVDIIRVDQPLEDDNTPPFTDHTHTFGAYTTTKAPTALAEGTKIHICTACGYTESMAIPKLTPTLMLNVTILPLKVKQSTTKVIVSGLADGDSVKSWESSDTKVATISNSGKITGKKVGKATVTVTLASGKQGTIAVTVQKKAVKTTKISGLSKKLTLKKGKKAVLKPVITPITSLEKVKYKSSNKKVATVSSKGVIKAKAPGKAKITVISGKKKVTVKITVTKK